MNERLRPNTTTVDTGVNRGAPPEVERRLNEIIGLQARLLIGSHNEEAFNPDKPVDGALTENLLKSDYLGNLNGTYGVVRNASTKERIKHYREIGDTSPYEQKMTGWKKSFINTINNNKTYFANEDEGKKRAILYHKLGIPTDGTFSDTQAQEFYDRYFTGPNHESDIKRFVQDVLEVYTPKNNHVTRSELLDNLEGIKWLANVFGENSAEVTTALIELVSKKSDKVAKDEFLKKAYGRDGIVYQLGPLAKDSKSREIVTFLWENGLDSGNGHHNGNRANSGQTGDIFNGKNGQHANGTSHTPDGTNGKNGSTNGNSLARSGDVFSGKPLETKPFVVTRKKENKSEQVPVTINSGSISEVGTRHAKNEDRLVREDAFGNKPQESFYAVYDGHGPEEGYGYEAAQLASEKLHEHFVKALADSNGDVNKALDKAFQRTDKEIKDLWIKNNPDKSFGTTAVVAYRQGDILHIANAGDSRAILVKRDTVHVLSHDHKPDDPEEQARIEKAGGTVYTYGVPRVQGLAVSRSLGDTDGKEIIAQPYIAHEIQLPDGNSRLIIASDGIWDVLKNEQVKDLIRDIADPSEASRLIKNEARRRGTTDDLTVIVVNFDKKPTPQK